MRDRQPRAKARAWAAPEFSPAYACVPTREDRRALPFSFSYALHLPANRYAAVDDEQLTREKSRRIGREKYGDTADIFGIAQTPQWRHAFAACAPLFVFPQG